MLVGDGNNDLHYLLAWKSLAERERVWSTFLADPAWIKARDDSEKDGPIIANIKSSFLQADGVLRGQVSAPRKRRSIHRTVVRRPPNSERRLLQPRQFASQALPSLVVEHGRSMEMRPTRPCPLNY